MQEQRAYGCVHSPLVEIVIYYMYYDARETITRFVDSRIVMFISVIEQPQFNTV